MTGRLSHARCVKRNVASLRYRKRIHNNEQQPIGEDKVQMLSAYLLAYLLAFILRITPLLLVRVVPAFRLQFSDSRSLRRILHCDPMLSLSHRCPRLPPCVSKTDDGTWKDPAGVMRSSGDAGHATT